MTGTNHTIENPKGIDVEIQAIQNRLFESVNWINCNVYGRVYKLNSENGIVPRAFISGKDYKDVFTDDRKTASIFFICDDQHDTKEGVLFTSKVKIVFMVNLDKINKTNTKRIDTDVQIEVIEVINSIGRFYFKGSLETGLDSIFKGFNTDYLKKTDLQPFHVFAINGEVTYSISDGHCFK